MGPIWRLFAASRESADEIRGRRRSKDGRCASGRLVDDAAVFGDDEMEKFDIGKNFETVVDEAAGDEYKSASAITKAPE